MTPAMVGGILGDMHHCLTAMTGEHWRRAAALYVVPISNIIRSRIFVTANNQIYERRSANRNFRARSSFSSSTGRQSGFRKKMLTYINKN